MNNIFEEFSGILYIPVVIVLIIFFLKILTVITD